MEESISLTIVLAIIGSNGLFALIQFLIKRRDEKKGKTAEILKKLDDLQSKQEAADQDRCRTQLLLLISDYPSESLEIMKVAHHYFSVLHGDWYMTGLFNQWLVQNNVGKPEWFNAEAK